MSKQSKKNPADKKTPKKHQTLKINLPFEEAIRVAFTNVKYPDANKK